MAHRSSGSKILAVAACLIGSPALAAAPLTDNQLDGLTAGTLFNVTAQVANLPNMAPVTDPSLVNPWGISTSPTGAQWVANQGTSTATTFAPGTFKVSRMLNLQGEPTGSTFIGAGNAFDISAGGKTGGASFAFATTGGQILGWNQSVSPTGAVVAVDQSAQHASFTGLTLGMNGQQPLLFAADFSQGMVEIFNNKFAQVGQFTDPSVPAGYAPFNAQVLNGNVYVTYALFNPSTGRSTAGQGAGFVDVFNTQGQLLSRLIPNGGKLNAPWGLAMAPSSFGQFAGDLLVGNFGNGKINAFNPQTGAFIGQVDNASGAVAVIPGLWALHPQSNGTILFSAGPQNETGGLLGTISAQPAAPPAPTPAAKPTTSPPPTTPPPTTPAPMTPTPMTVPPMPFGYSVAAGMATMMHR
jgi:uncharacterized protein (TIGR03118 family)